MPTANEQMHDAALRHQTYVLRYSAGVRNKINALLDETEDEISGKLFNKFGNSNQIVTSSDWKRLTQLQNVIFEIRGEAWKSAGSMLYDESLALAHQESQFFTMLIASTSPVILDIVTPHAETLKAIVTERPFQGRLLSAWVDKYSDEDITRINKLIGSGITQGQSAKEVARQIFGTIQAKGTDGITQTTRSDVDAMVRTAMQHITSSVRRDIALSNIEVIELEKFVAMLDGKTSMTCKGLDGKTFKPGEGPHPPLHIRCRSARVMFISQDIGNRPSKPVTDRLLVKEYAEKNGLSKVDSRDDLPYGTKTDFDEWSRKRVRELVGPVPRNLNYNDWLQTQSADFQLDTLGKTRSELFRNGGLKLDRFIDADGTTLTLQEVARRDAAAFERAGLDVSKFLH